MLPFKQFYFNIGAHSIDLVSVLGLFTIPVNQPNTYVIVLSDTKHLKKLYFSEKEIEESGVISFLLNPLFQRMVSSRDFHLVEKNCVNFALVQSITYPDGLPAQKSLAVTRVFFHLRGKMEALEIYVSDALKFDKDLKSLLKIKQLDSLSEALGRRDPTKHDLVKKFFPHLVED